MSKIIDILLAVNETVNDFDMKRKKPLKPYSEPVIYTGGVDITQWKKLSPEEKEEALNKDWFVYYSFRHPETGKLKRLPNIKGGANYYHTKEERLEILETFKKSLSKLLKSGFNPFTPDNFTNNEDIKEYTVPEAFNYALSIKKKVLNETSYTNYEGRIKRFLKWLIAHGYENRFITSVTVHTVIKYLNEVLQNSSAANRNNTRLDISSLFSAMKNEFIIPENFVKDISVLNSTPERNKSYTTTQEDDVFEYMKENDPLLLLFVKFVSYNFLRPVEVCRLRVEDIHIKDRTLSVRAKNKPVKIKIIPEILLNDLPDLTKCSKKDFLFTPTGPGPSETNEDDRRSYFGKRFKKVKDHFKLGSEYGLYSFRHTFISKLYNQLIKEKTPFEAESYLMEITGHKTIDALRKYLREIDAYRPEDYSKHLKK